MIPSFTTRSLPSPELRGLNDGESRASSHERAAERQASVNACLDHSEGARTARQDTSLERSLACHQYPDIYTQREEHAQIENPSTRPRDRQPNRLKLERHRHQNRRHEDPRQTLAIEAHGSKEDRRHRERDRDRQSNCTTAVLWHS